MVFYGLHSLICQEVFDWFMTQEEAEADLAQVLVDEPDWVGEMDVVRVDLGTATVAPLSPRP